MALDMDRMSKVLTNLLFEFNEKGVHIQVHHYHDIPTLVNLLNPMGCQSLRQGN
ncbi:hypothetical protein LINGRAHAP2_LOCUS23219 [Linum grandiflorum]